MMLRLVVPILLAGIAAAPSATAAEAAPDRPGFAKFWQAPALKRTSTTVDVYVDPVRGQPAEYRFRRTYKDLKGESLAWTDTRSCPQARGALAAATKLQMPQPQVPGLDPAEELSIIMDGVGYGLETWAQPPYTVGKLTITSNVGSPLAKWVEDTLKVLEPCWQAKDA